MFGVEDHGAGRNGNQQVFARAAVATGAAAGLTALRLPLRAMRERGKAIDPLLGDQNHAAAVAAVAAVRPAAGYVLFPAEADRPVAPLARFHSDFRFVDEHGRLLVNLSSVAGPARRAKTPT